MEIKDRKQYIMDIETLSNLYSYTGLNIDTNEVKVFIIHESKNQLNELIEHWRNISGEIGYNSLSFDSQVNQYIINNYNKLKELTGEKVTHIIYEYAQRVIAKQTNGEWLDYPEWKLLVPQLDLFKIWHFDNKAKLTSLKKVQFAINWKNLQDMPIHHSAEITVDQIPMILDYNLNDVLATKEFYLITKGITDNKLYKGINKIKLRKDIEIEFGIKCANYNDVKIGDEINKLNYLKATNIDKRDLKSLKTERPIIYTKDCIADFIKFRSEQLNNFLKKIKTQEITNIKNGFKESIIYKGVQFTFGQGGIHTVDKGRKITPNEDEILEDRDCASMYPTWIINNNLFPSHLGMEWLNGYVWTKNKRIEAKGLYKTTKDLKYQAIQEAYKLALNGGGYGKTGEINSWQYDPLITMHTTISNQLCLLMLCEEYLDNDIKVISANTDGVVILYKKHQKEKVEEIDKFWQEITNHVLEYVEYKIFVQSSVNDYIAVKTDGKAKYKGDFDPMREIHKDHSFRIIPIALSEYFTKGIPIEKTIKNHTDIFNFCGRNDSNKDCYSEIRYLKSADLIKEKQQKTTRYYISTNGSRFLRVYTGGKQIGGEEAINKGYKVTIFNTYFEKSMKEYSIDYQFYISEAHKIINVVENYNQLTLF